MRWKTTWCDPPLFCIALPKIFMSSWHSWIKYSISSYKPPNTCTFNLSREIWSHKGFASSCNAPKSAEMLGMVPQKRGEKRREWRGPLKWRCWFPNLLLGHSLPVFLLDVLTCTCVKISCKSGKTKKHEPYMPQNRDLRKWAWEKRGTW